MRFHRPRKKNRTLHPQQFHPTFHNTNLDRDNPRHLNCTTKRNFAITLREMEISNREPGARDVDGKISLRATGEIFDVAVSAVFRTARDCAGPFTADFRFNVGGGGTGVDIRRLGRVRDGFASVGGNQLRFTAVPFSKDFRGGCGSHDAGVNETGEADARDVAGGTENAFEIPNRFGSLGVEVGEEAATVVLIKDSAET